MCSIDPIEIDAFLAARKNALDLEYARLNNVNDIINNSKSPPTKTSQQNDCYPVSHQHANGEQIDASQSEEKENLVQPAADPNRSNALGSGQEEASTNQQRPSANNSQNVHLLTKQDLSYVDISKEPAINTLFRADASTRPAMLRYGDYSPNNLHLRVPAHPQLGFGEYDHQTRRKFLRQQLCNDYKQHLDKKNELVKSAAGAFHKAVQTDIQNVNYPLIQYSRATNVETNTAEGDLFGPPSTNLTTIESCVMHNNRSPVLHRLDQRITAAHSNLLKSEMDKPRGILTNRNQTPRERLLSDLKHSYLPPGGNLYNGYSVNSYNDRSEQMERERIKREIYQNELRLQIEEKRRLATMREEQERKEQELENKRLEQQLLRMQEEQLRDEQRRNRRELIRRNSDDFATRKQEMQSRFRKHAESESGLGSMRNASKLSSHYSPPVSRRTLGLGSGSGGGSVSASVLPYSSYGGASPGASSASRYDSLSRIDALKQQDALNSRLESLSLNDSLSRVQRRHSATQQDLSLRRSPKLQRRSSSGRFDDPSLPIQLLKATHSPVARELKYSQAVTSATSRYSSSEALRKLEDRWQIPAVQKSPNAGIGGRTSSNCRNVLSQLGAIRMQLQREQMRMDETMRERERAAIASHTGDTSQGC